MCCSVLKSRPYFRPQNVVFHTRFLPFVISVFIVYYYFNISNFFHITTSTAVNGLCFCTLLTFAFFLFKFSRVIINNTHKNTTVKLGVVFLKSVGNNYDKFVPRIFDERITPENMHNEVCKMALGVHSKASNHAVKGGLRRFPLHLIIYTRIF